ncbi:hypothetical protein TKK_0007844 [Trichogramma kaykai]|uniref:Histone-lysine N-methyltransferase eggless n=1 Tax=Trichogramma kaykai TaxID=54128 RepID=A0ABD2X7C5_9HYME
MATSKVTEVINLDSDDDNAENEEKKTNAKCINFECNSGKLKLKSPPPFACAFYGVNNNEKKKLYICQECLNTALEHQDKLIQALLNSEPVIKYELPDHTMQVEISDSDDSDNDTIQKDCLSIVELSQFKEKLTNTYEEVFKTYNIDYQIRETHSDLKSKLDEINASNKEMEKQFSTIMGNLDSYRRQLYDEFKPDIKMLEELTINDDNATTNTSSSAQVATKKVTRGQCSNLSNSIVDNQPEILQVAAPSNKLLGTMNLPPTGQLIKPVPEIDDYVFTMKHPLFPWIKGKVQQISSKSPMQYKVKLLQKKYAGQIKTLSGKHMAYSKPSPVIIPVGTRVVAIFQDTYSSNYYSGVIAEPPKSTNLFRYLVFFDDGYAQYVYHRHIFLVCESSRNVWEDIPLESRDFVKKYMESYPERPMVKLQKGQVVKTEWNGKWWIARVREVDASLVQMHFDADNRTEWIYRGSARLGPLYVEFMKANLRQQGCHSSLNTPRRHNTIINKNGPYVEYTSTATDERDAFINDTKSKHSGTVNNTLAESVAPQQARAVAKKSTAKRSITQETTSTSISTTYSTNTETKPSHSIVYYQTQNKIQTKKYKIHNCSPECVKAISFTPDDLRGYSPLSIPLLCGWNRQLCRFPKGKQVILYQAPCGVRLRNMEELHKYLRITGCPMSVDLFEFDYWVHCLAEFVLDKCFVNIKDLSYGVENVPIPCVNEIDHAFPDAITYATRRQPEDDVHINLDPEFLCSCDCEDDCADKTKCQCWQLTIQGATLGGRVPNAAVGYVYKRLPEAVTTGIYECNSRCKCSVKTCLNRVVQHPLNLKLQVFKTAPRGWGIRCLNDIPLGSFICIYAGRLLTEQGANEGGKNYGDEYLAELDYVEVVESIKEGYESDALEPEMEGNAGNDDITDTDFNISAHKMQDDNVDSANASEDEDSRSSIRRRLRKRKKYDEDNASKDGQEKGSDEEDPDEIREPSKLDLAVDTTKVEKPKFKSVRDFFGEDESVYIMDAKTTGNIGRYLNHSCDPNVFVQNVFVDTHDVRFPWVAFFALNYIRAGQELTWNYSYDVGSIPGKVIICKCGASNCRGRLL